MDGPMMRLPFLRTVTLETMRTPDNTELLEKLALVRASGRARQRTCKQAEDAAHEAKSNPTYSENDGVVSPLWFSPRFDDSQRETW